MAAAFLFLASDMAGFITGEILDVNGGFLMNQTGLTLLCVQITPESGRQKKNQIFRSLIISPDINSGLNNQFQFGPLVIFADFVAV